MSVLLNGSGNNKNKIQLKTLFQKGVSCLLSVSLYLTTIPLKASAQYKPNCDIDPTNPLCEIQQHITQNFPISQNLDVLWVIDNSKSQNNYNKSVMENLQHLVQLVNENQSTLNLPNYKIQMAVTTTDLTRIDQVLSKSSAHETGSHYLQNTWSSKASDSIEEMISDLYNKVANLTAIPNLTAQTVSFKNPESGLASSLKFFKENPQWVRDDAQLVLIYMSDEEDYSFCTQPGTLNVHFEEGKKKQKKNKNHGKHKGHLISHYETIPHQKDADDFEDLEDFLGHIHEADSHESAGCNITEMASEKSDYEEDDKNQNHKQNHKHKHNQQKKHHRKHRLHRHVVDVCYQYSKSATDVVTELLRVKGNVAQSLSVFSLDTVSIYQRLLPSNIKTESGIFWNQSRYYKVANDPRISQGKQRAIELLNNKNAEQQNTQFMEEIGKELNQKRFQFVLKTPIADSMRSSVKVSLMNGNKVITEEIQFSISKDGSFIELDQTQNLLFKAGDFFRVSYDL